MTTDFAALIRALEAAKEDAARVHEADQASGQAEKFIAFDAGRYDGLVVPLRRSHT